MAGYSNVHVSVLRHINESWICKQNVVQMWTV